MGFNDGKPFGIDISKNQGIVDFGAIGSHEPRVEFIGIRYAISWAYIDSFYKTNTEGAMGIGRVVLPYHALYPGEPVIKQMDHFMKLLDPYIGKVFPVEDVELVHDCSPRQIQDAAFTALEFLKARLPKPPIFYSRATYIDEYLTGINNAPSTELNKYDWWLAQYVKTKIAPFSPFTIEHPGPVWLPRGVTRERCIIHQTGDHTQGFGVQSEQLDYDRWQGDLISFYEYFGIGETTPEEPNEPEMTVEKKVYQIMQREVKPLL